MSSEPRFWSTWKGRIIRAIVLDGSYTQRNILESTRLEEDQFQQALRELFQTGLLMETARDRYLVNDRDLCKEYRSYGEEIKQDLLSWVRQWRRQEKLETELNHFFLEDKLLDKFSENLIEHARVEILVTNPYVEQCHISNSLVLMSKKGVVAKLLTRSPNQYQYEKKKKYLSKLSQEGVYVSYEESIHAKLTVVDRGVAIVSSMNFVAASSGGASWEAGIVTTEEKVVRSVVQAIMNRSALE